MRILNSITLHGWSAASWYAVEMMRGLGARGHEIVFLVPEGRTAGRARAEGFEVVVEPDLRQVAPRSIGSVLKALRELRDRQVDPDIVLAHGGPDQVWWALVRDGRRPLVRVRSHDPRPPARHPLSRWLNRRATAAVFVANETQRRACVRRLGVEPERVWRLPPGFDTARWARGPDGSRVRAACGIDRGTPLIASIARFAPQKDHETFFAAAARLVRNHPEVHILAAGYPAEFSTDQIRTLAARHPDLESRLTIWDRRLEEGQELVRAADIGVIHSGGSEAICRVAFEYMAEGIPIVANRIGILPEVLDDNGSALLIPPGQPSALAGALTRLLGGSSLRRRLTSAATLRLNRLFDPATAVDRFEQALLSLNAGTGRGY